MPVAIFSPKVFNTRRVLLSGSAVAALCAAIPVAYAGGVNILSGKGGGGAAPAAAASQAAAQQGAAAAQQAAQQSVNALTKASQAIQAMRAAQSAARSLAIQAPTNVTNGLSPGGLVVDPRVGTDPSLWVNASKPTQQVTNGQVTVTIEQQAQKALLTWQQFNVGRETTVRFDQSKGNAASGNNWVALNRINATGAPSQILGQIKAEGTVLLINPNGIIFNGSSQVNVGSLIASSASIDPAAFMSTGIYSTQSGSAYLPSFTNAGGKISVEAGAEITTAAPKSVTSGGGYVMLMGTEVSNSGTISTPKGQALLSAGDSFILRSGYSTASNQFSTTRGTEISPVIAVGSASGKVTNAGLIFSQQGDITLAGHDVTQGGILVATTSVNQRGTIHLLNAMNDATGSVTLTGDAITAILPELDSKDTALNAQRDALIAASGPNILATGQFNNLSTLADRLDQSRVEIVTGGNAVFQGGSYTAAQGGQITVQAGKRIFTETGATLDVSGVRNVALAMGSNNISINVQGNELRDSPQNRDSGYLANENVWIDVRNLTLVPAGTGGYASDRYYTPGGLLEVGGYLGNTAHTIGEWTAVGGTVTLSAPEVVAQKGSIFNLSGGSVAYQGGYIRTTNFLGADGRLYNIGDNAPADMKYYGVGSGFIRDHEHWGQVEVWMNPFGLNRDSYRWEDGYTVGRDAGRLILSTPTSVFEGDILASVIQGERQINARPTSLTDGYKATQNIVAKAGSLVVGRYDQALANNAPYTVDIRVGDFADITGNGLPTSRTGTAWFNAARLNKAGLGGLTLETGGTIRITESLKLADGGVLDMIAPTIDIAANVSARGGSVRATNWFESHMAKSIDHALLNADGQSRITLREGATLDLRGLWVNAMLNAADYGKLARIDGGVAFLASTGDVTLENGSLIDVSSGAAVLPQGGMKGGTGGNVSLIADLENDTQVTDDGLLTLNGRIAAYGVNGGGTLKIESGTAISIGGKLTETDGVLKAGETSPVNLILAENISLGANEPLPLDYRYTATIVPPGEVLGVRPDILINNPGDWVVLKADWVLPYSSAGGRLGEYAIVYRLPGQTVQQTVRMSDEGTRLTIPAGSTIVAMSSPNFPTNYVLPANIFSSGVRTVSHVRTAKAGSTLPFAVTIAQGTSIAAGTAVPRSIQIKGNLQISGKLFNYGFGTYDVTARNGVVVTEGTKLDVTTPVLRFTEAAWNTATAAPSGALETWLPPLYLEDPVKGALTQRKGAGITLRSSQYVASSTNATTGGGPLVIAKDASVTVDPGKSINLLGFDMTIEGSLMAPAGSITLNLPEAFDNNGYGNPAPNLIWIGEKAILDVAARAATAVDARGRRYGQVADAGTISIGGDLDWEASGEAFAPNAFVVIRPGALLDASGARALLDIQSNAFAPAQAPVSVASNGGTITIKSDNGLYLDGTLRAAAGGEGAAGGTLALALEAPNYLRSTTSGDVLNPREFIVAQTGYDSRLSGGLTPQSAVSQLSSGRAKLSVEQVEAGGFDNLSILVNGALSFDGNVSLDLDQSLRLYAKSNALSESASADAAVSLSAPYVRLAGVTRVTQDNYTMPSIGWTNGISQRPTDAQFRVAASVLDVRDTVGFGLNGSSPATAEIFDRRGFAAVELASTGDLRLLRGTWRKNNSQPNDTALETTGNIVLTAAQIYPASEAKARIVAGALGADSGFAEGTSLTIRRYGDELAAIPYSTFGSLVLAAETVNQGGVVRAPFGSLTLGSNPLAFLAKADSVNLLAGSITSISGQGLTMPFGGSVDGIVYNYDGQKIDLAATTAVRGKILSKITLQSAHIDSQQGSVLDLSGGGELTGAGFVSGRGGSVDILKTPFINANPGFGFSAVGNAVYAIVPSGGASYAPVTAESGFGDPLIGQQVTIADGVPGLPAGSYTLMPSTYALQKGAFRVEIGAGDQVGLNGITAIGNGSYVAPGVLRIANTDIRESLPNQIIITPAEAVRTHSSYNEMSYNAFVIADAARIGVPRTTITSDAGSLGIDLYYRWGPHVWLPGAPGVTAGTRVGAAYDIAGCRAAGTCAPIDDKIDTRPALGIDGAMLLDPLANSNGFGGSVRIGGIGEITAAGRSRTQGFDGVSVGADALSAFNAPRLMLNSEFITNYGQTGIYVDIRGSGDLVVRSGAEIKAGEIILASASRFDGNKNVDGNITIEEGASLIAKAGKTRAFDSSDGYLFRADGALIISSGWTNLLLNAPATGSASGVGVKIGVGACVTDACQGVTSIVSDGTIAIATNQALTIADNVSYGTKNLLLGVSSVNLGERAEIDAARAAGQLPDGFVLNQGRLAELLNRNTATNAPSLETFVVNARDAVNVYGAVTLDTSSLERLVFGTPAIYGYGAAGDVATIRASEFVWTGAEATAGAPVAGLLGSSKLAIEANSILFGYGPNTQPASTAKDARLALGFADVYLGARERIAASGESTLAVYQTRGNYVSSGGWQYAGGNLSISAPLVTGNAGSKFGITAGGDVAIINPSDKAADLTSDKLGAQLAISGRNITTNTNIVLPSGKLTLQAAGNIVLGNKAHIDLAGREVSLFDVKKYSGGGDIILTSASGDITSAVGSDMDLSARNNRGGTMVATALGADAGVVDLRGAIKGGATGQYDAGGTTVLYDAAEFALRAQTLTDFAGLNALLNSGEVFGARRFQIKEGDLTVGDGVKASDVEIVVDGGDLTVNGTIDASGLQVGSIRLAAMGNLTVNGMLDAHGTGLRVDSYGKIIDSPNRAVIDLTSRAGTLTLTNRAAFDLRAGTAVNGHDGKARGTLDLNAKRIGSDDVAINVLGAIGVAGAKTIAVNAFRTYDDAPLATLPDVSGNRPQLITQAYLDTIDVQSRTFINAARGNSALSSRLSGLGEYHLRPGVEIVSNSVTNPLGTLTVAGDLDLSGYRYGPNANRDNPALRGYGEPGVLVLRAGGDLNIYGSINDGFAPPAATPDDSGWVLNEGQLPFGGDLIVPGDGVVLDTGTTFQSGVTLNYDVPLTAMRLASGTVLPVDAQLIGNYSIAAGTVIAANIYNSNGSIAYAAGTVLSETVTLTAGMRLGAGTKLNAITQVSALTWPKGVPLPTVMNAAGRADVATTSSPVTLMRGSRIPSTTNVQLVGDTPIDLRSPVEGRQGVNWAVAPMLGDGATSWTTQLVAGADLGSANVRALNPLSSGAIRLADGHYTYNFKEEMVGGFQWVWSDDNYYGGVAGTPVEDWALDPSWNVCEMEAGQCEKKSSVKWVWAPDNYYGGVAGEDVEDWALDPSWNVCEMEPGQCIQQGGETVTVKDVPVMPALSVVRTGTGDLSLIAVGDVRMESLYGVYTAGTSNQVDAAYNLPRGSLADGSVMGDQLVDYSGAISSYRAWYPNQGGNLLISAGRDLVGDIMENADYKTSSTVVSGNWLWRQGSGSATVDSAVSTAWWINFGTYARIQDGNGQAGDPMIVGFTGFGTLGGGNVSVRVGGDAGKITLRGIEGQGPTTASRSQGLVIAVGSTGRVATDGGLMLTGGGDLKMRVGGALNPLGEANDRNSKTSLSGSIINLRGLTTIDAASIGDVRAAYRSGTLMDPVDPRGVSAFEQPQAIAYSGPLLVPGDSAVYLQSLRAMVIGGAGDATRSQQRNTSGFSVDGTPYAGGGNSWFTLWTEHTAINMTSLGGNMAPSKAGYSTFNGVETTSDLTDSWPAILRIAALEGNIYYGAAAGYTVSAFTKDVLAPSASGELAILAAGSIYGSGRDQSGGNLPSRHVVILSSTGTPLPTPFNPAFVGKDVNTASNISLNSDAMGDDASTGYWNQKYSLFAFGPNSAAIATPRSTKAEPIRIYARDGDIVGLGTGETRTYNEISGRTILTWYLGGAPMRMMAGRDIVSSGDSGSHNLIVHGNATDISVVSAGRDILYNNLDIAGPGSIEISAGRNILQEDLGSFMSIGAVRTGDTRSGASIALMAGLAEDANWHGVRDQYLNPENLAVSGTPLAEQPGKVAHTYQVELIAWLKERFGHESTDATEALAYFKTLAPEQQMIFLRTVYFAELREGGREYNDVTSSRYGSYVRGRLAIATLFPVEDGAGNPIAYAGNITMFGGSGVRTLFGGDISMLTPGGRMVIGVEGVNPPGTAGIITQGSGNISLYSKGDILLGQSRIMTTFGGNILAWSAEGDINAGRGSKTTAVYTPPKRIYDEYGHATLSPMLPSSGAGIATLNPIPEVEPGDIDLIAPLGAIDAGEAGIRFSGDANFAAREIVNATNITGQGTVTGIPVVQPPNVSGLTQATNTASATTKDTSQMAHQGAPTEQPSIIIVEVVGYGGGDGSNQPGSEDKRRKAGGQQQDSYDPNSGFRAIGNGRLTEEQRSKLTERERQNLDKLVIQTDAR